MKLIDLLERSVTKYPDRIAVKDDVCEMSYAQLLAGYSISLAGTNAMHAFSYPLTVKYNVPHGTGCAVTTIGFMNSVKKEKEKELQMITDAIGADNTEINQVDMV